MSEKFSDRIPVGIRPFFMLGRNADAVNGWRKEGKFLSDLTNGNRSIHILPNGGYLPGQ